MANCDVDIKEWPTEFHHPYNNPDVIKAMEMYVSHKYHWADIHKTTGVNRRLVLKYLSFYNLDKYFNSHT